MDLTILEVIQKDCRLSLREISKKTGIPPATIDFRIKKMEERNIIYEYSARVDYKRIGLEITNYVFIKIDLKELRRMKKTYENIVEEISTKYPYVTHASVLNGPYNLLVRLRAESQEQLNQFLLDLNQMQGIREVESNLVLSERIRHGMPKSVFSKTQKPYLDRGKKPGNVRASTKTVDQP